LAEPRYRRVLEAAVSRFTWESGISPTKRGVGLSIGEDVGTYVASCVELSVEGREIRVRRVVTAIDCGLIVNPEGVRNQVEGSTVMGLGGALYEAMEIGDGMILNTSLSRYQVQRMTDTPEIEVVMMDNPHAPPT